MKPGFDYTGVTLAFYCHDGERNFVLQKRSIRCRDEQGRWDNGGGQLEFGEDFADGLLRELAEEYGCEGIIEEQLPPLSILRQHEGRTTHWVQIGFFVFDEWEEGGGRDVGRNSVSSIRKGLLRQDKTDFFVGDWLRFGRDEGFFDRAG